MDWTYSSLLKFWKQGDRHQLLHQSEHAVERECLRVDKTGHLALTPHPKVLGSALESPSITTDFSEAQLELVTPRYKKEEQALRFLKNTHRFIAQNLENELLWSSSAPCELPKGRAIPIADYGTSDLAQEKVLYRKGLTSRYGAKMQTLSGLHYNFSFSEDAVQEMHGAFGDQDSLTSFQSEMYLHLLRNFLRFGWLNTYLFGATPAMDRSYLDALPSTLSLLDKQTLYAPHATSLRMGPHGYYSRIQDQLAISFNSLEEYLRDLDYALQTPNALFTKLGVMGRSGPKQMNDSYLQIEAEHYSRMRPKPRFSPDQRPIDLLRENGIAYVEARAVDISPFSSAGLDLDQLLFLHLFMLYCLFEESTPISKKQQRVLTRNQTKVALEGRAPGLKLERNGQKVTLQKWAGELFEHLAPIAALLDEGAGTVRYRNSLKRQMEKVENSSKTPSGKILHALNSRGISFQQFSLELADEHTRNLKDHPLGDSLHQRFARAAEHSLEAQDKREVLDDYFLRGYESLELSTQMVIREAKRRKIAVDVLDAKENIIRLRKGKRVEIVKQATYTDLDHQLSYFLMENKHVCKQLLAEQGIYVPMGKIYHTKQEALDDFASLSNGRVVVKPNHANYGDGIGFVNSADHQSYEVAIHEAFAIGSQVLVEEFCEGEEYRFLVVKGKVVAICQRVPANIIGDGQHTVRQLVHRKNQNPRCYKAKYPVRMGGVEKRFLEKQGLTFKTTPKKGERIFLRENSNISTGGDSIDKTGQLPKAYSEIAIKAAQTLDTTFCGVDIMIAKMSSQPAKGDYTIIELNFNPALFIHRYPVQGSKQYVEKVVLDTLSL